MRLVNSRPLAIFDLSFIVTFLFPELRSFCSSPRRAQLCFFFSLQANLSLQFCITQLMHLSSDSYGNNNCRHSLLLFLKILTQQFRRDPFAKNVWVHLLFCHPAISRFFACRPRVSGRGNNDASETPAQKEIGQRPICERLLSTTNKMADADESFLF